MSLWNPENIRDVGESVGLGHLSKEVVENLARDVDYRIAQVLEQSIKFMRHAKRTTLHTDDVAQALKALDIEPLFGYDSQRPLRFGEASIGPGQPLYYVEDEEVDFEKLINAPLPKIPREVSFTAHWLAIEGVQPSIPQNPTSADSRHQELLPKGPNANPNLAAASGLDSASVKPLVKHVLSSELQLYFERITTTIFEDQSEEARTAAFNSIRTDPGIHQLVPYFIQFIADKVTHHSKDRLTLKQVLRLSDALLQNKSLYIEPYVGAFVPSILTCLIGKQVGSPSDSTQSIFEVRELAAAIIMEISRSHAKTSTTLKPRLARTLLKAFLDPNRTFGAQYGAILGIRDLTGSEGVRVLIIPNLKTYDTLLKEGLADSTKREEAEMVVVALYKAIAMCSQDMSGKSLTNGVDSVSEEEKQLVVERIGEVLGSRVTERRDLTRVIMETDFSV
jgi:transcription initiation factor TFIID subunit 6